MVHQEWYGLAAMQPKVFGSPTNIFEPAATPAHSIFGLSMLVFGITGAIFVIVSGLLLYALIRYRSKATDLVTSQEPPQIYGSNQIELSWTVIPILLVVMLFLATARVVYSTEHAVKPTDALDVSLTGHQFWWEFQYPKLGVVTANELHVPVSNSSSPLPTYLAMSSADTDHSFWVPRLSGKMDVIPNKVNVMWIDPERPGIYLGQCAEYCGTSHAKMLIRVYADTPQEFFVWIANQRKPAIEDPSVKDGRDVFEHNACINCHTIRGTVATGRYGPDLTHVASRDTILSGSVPNNTTNLHSFIQDPQSLKPGVQMPEMHLNSHDLDAVTAYLSTLK